MKRPTMGRDACRPSILRLQSMFTLELVPSGESSTVDRGEDGTRQIGGSRFGGESTSEARREGREPLRPG
jgi:hypothetical protein